MARFGVFEADLLAGELRKQGRLVRLQQQPFELLKALLARPNEVVTRDDLRRRLWPADVVVDFDQSLNKSVTKLRDALGDSAASPRFVETLPKRGYRFVAPVAIIENDRSRDLAVAAAGAEGMPVKRVPAFLLWPTIWLSVAAIAGALAFGTDVFRQPDRPATSSAQATPFEAAGTSDALALDAYERGRIALSRRSEAGLRSGVALFERALALDPGYAAAYVGLADSWSLLASYGVEEPRDAMARSRDHASRALAIDPRSAAAHASLGRTAMIADWDWTGAESHFQRAIRFKPNDPTAHQWYAYLLSATGRHAEAEREARTASALAPLSLNAATSVGYVLYAARRFDDAAAAMSRVVQVDPDFMQARRNVGMILAAQGRYREAIPEFERVVRLSGESAGSQAELAWVTGRAGDVTGARRLLARLQTRNKQGYVPPDRLSLALVGAGEMDLAVATLDAAFKERVSGMAHLAVDPVWDVFRDIPRVRAMADTVRAGGLQ